MFFPKYWAKGSKNGVICWGFSERSLDEAKAVAQARAEKVAAVKISERVRSSQYGYTDRPLREEVLEQVKFQGQLTGVVSRNRYGALVLNTNGLMFLDLDAAPKK